MYLGEDDKAGNLVLIVLDYLLKRKYTTLTCSAFWWNVMASESAFCLDSTRVCRLPWRFFISHALSFSSAEAKWLSASISSLLDRSDSTSEAMRCGGEKRKGSKGGRRGERRGEEGRKEEEGRERRVLTLKPHPLHKVYRQCEIMK